MKEYTKGLVSIIIPTYNQGAYIKEAVNSCLTQSYKDIEIIVVDDGSTDNTKEIMMPFIKEGVIKYIYQANSERSAARNNGIRAAQGEFLQFLDSDDLLDKEKIKMQVDFLNLHPEIFAVYGVSKQFKEHPGDFVLIKPKELIGDISHELIKWNFITINAVVSRRDDIYFDESLNTAEDWDYWLKLSLKGRKFAYMEQSVCYVRWHGSNTSHNKRLMLIGELKVLEKTEADYGSENMSGEKIKQLQDLITYGMFQRLYRLKNNNAMEKLYQVLKINKKLFVKGLIFAVINLKNRC
ncbi:glycosyltransferase family 2 protein [Pseudobacteroides cellulosolvens]|uniref:Glycosyl transferase family 2 n=1 Tax=Pseudobacteroides cellulosolvens ATCC 35603 = DSM 2933 TaxID=398512 RepID=A0A0L6JVH6_9FIRM|nr:glycosyltransferase [Pseudobacteroides cellulosolvens]KNY29645.1 glycosyl transferase family 2 [Pseudobacteroides cellulosolvens ATCC 35603 = DSM 2933]